MKCLRPTYLGEFKCDGQTCSSRCCKNWRVVIDHDTYKKFLALDDHNIIDKISVDNNAFTVKLKDNGDCPFLDNDLLCSIQKKYGEAHLSSICQAYPRVTYRLNDLLEQSLTLTCPVAARSILLSTAPISFEYVEIDPPRFIFDWSSRIASVDQPVEIQMQCIKLLQDRSLTVDRRLKNLCLLLNPQAVDHEITFDIESHAEIMLNIFEQTYSVEMSADKKFNIKNFFVELRAEILSGLSRGTVFENYLVNEFFMRCYPFARDRDRWSSCKTFIVGFKAMQFALVLNAIAKGGRLSVDETLNMINVLNERLDHNRGGMAAGRAKSRRL